MCISKTEDKLSFTAPSWISKLGIPIIILISFSITSIMHLVHYPEIITYHIVITQPLAKNSLKIKLLKSVVFVESKIVPTVKLHGKVNVKLYDFPYTTYGVLAGYVDSISVNRITKKAQLFLIFPEKRTSFNFSLPEGQNLQGIVEIYSTDMSIFDRLILKYIN